MLLYLIKNLLTFNDQMNTGTFLSCMNIVNFNIHHNFWTMRVQYSINQALSQMYKVSGKYHDK